MRRFLFVQVLAVVLWGWLPGWAPAAAPLASATLVLNEIDYDQPGTDTAEFIEIKNVSPAPINLGAASVELVNGSGGGAAVYRTINLPGVDLAPGGYYVICGSSATVPNCSQAASVSTDLIQNGAPDAVGLRVGGVLVDAVSYEGNTGSPYTEDSGVGLIDDGATAGQGLSRCADGADTDLNNVDWRLRPISPGAANACPGEVDATIAQIQGAGHRSPLEGWTVHTADSVVTAVAHNGFWMQTPDGSTDSDPATAEGIYVYTAGAPGVSVGDRVALTGAVQEYQPGTPGNDNLTITELVDPTLAVISAGNPLPSPVVLGAAGRAVPTATIEDDGLTLFDPATDGLDFYESLEGMRVEVDNALVIGPTRPGSSGKDTWVVGDAGAAAGPRTARGGVRLTASDAHPERIRLSARSGLYPGGSAAWPDLAVGSVLTAPAVGVLHYDDGNYALLMTQAAGADSSAAVTREVTALAAAAGRLTVATFNVDNLGAAAPAADFAARAAQIAGSLRSPDIVALEEMQDNSGAVDDGVTAADQTFARLIQAIAAAGGPVYAYTQIDPQDGQDGGAPGGNIRIGFLYNPARVALAPHAGDAVTPTGVQCHAGVPSLALNPGRIDPANAAFAGSRKPLAVQFTVGAQAVFVIGVHFNSKGGDTPLFGAVQPPHLASETKRLAQAQIVHSFVAELLACDADAAVIVLGDMNDFPWSAPVVAVRGEQLTNLMDLLPGDEQYSYVYEGNSQVLDQALASARLAGGAAYDVVHINSEFPDQISDHDPGLAQFTMNSVADLPLRAFLPLVTQ